MTNVEKLDNATPRLIFYLNVQKITQNVCQIFEEKMIKIVRMASKIPKMPQRSHNLSSLHAFVVLRCHLYLTFLKKNTKNWF